MKSRYIALCLTAVILFFSFRYLLPLVLPFALAFLSAKLVSPLIHFMTKKLHWNRKASSVFVVLLGVTAAGGFLFYITSTLVGQTILLLQKFPVYERMFSQGIADLCCQCDQMLKLSAGTSYHYVEQQTVQMYDGIRSNLIPRLSSYALDLLKISAKTIADIFIFLVATLLLLLDDSLPAIRGQYKKLAHKLRNAGFSYLKSQVIIIFIIAAATSAGLFIIGNEYAILFGIGIALFDAFPVVGSGVILIPWAVVKAFSGSWFDAAVLATIFVIATFLREVLEPRLFAKDIGLKPLYVLLSVYAGIKLFHISGVVLGPISLTILKVVNEEWKEKHPKQ